MENANILNSQNPILLRFNVVDIPATRKARQQHLNTMQLLETDW